MPRDVTGSVFTCTCNTYYSLANVSATVTGGVCGAPNQTVGVVFDKASQDLPNYFLTVDVSVFRCGKMFRSPSLRS